MHFKDVWKGLEFSTLLDHITLSSVQEIEILTYENALPSFCLGNHMHTHSFNFHLCVPKLSPVRVLTWHAISNLTSLLGCLTGTSDSNILKLNSLYFDTPLQLQTLLFLLCSLLISWVVSPCVQLPKLETWASPWLFFSPHPLNLINY